MYPVPPVLGGTSTESAENYYTFQPQVGYQTREVSCRDSRGAIVDIRCVPVLKLVNAITAVPKSHHIT